MEAFSLLHTNVRNCGVFLHFLSFILYPPTPPSIHSPQIVIAFSAAAAAAVAAAAAAAAAATIARR